jgi:hypothetical protein
MLQAFRTLNFPDQQINRLQDNVADVLGKITPIALLDGVSVTAVLANGSNVVTHKLGRTPKGWFLTDLNASATIYRSATFSSTTITLTASAACSVVLWIF